MLIPTAPEKVELRFCDLGPDPSTYEARPLMVEAVNADTGDTVNLAPLRDTAAWLDANGYRWMPGTKAVWGRA